MQVTLNNLAVKAITSWLPEQRILMTSLVDKYGEDIVRDTIRSTGIEEVRIAEATMTSADMCQKAAEVLLAKEGIDKSEIDGIVFVSQTCDYLIPATSISLQERLGLSKDTICVDLHYACSGYVYGLHQAALWVSTGCCKNVLVLTGDTTSRMINPADHALNMEFGDCGTATLVGQGKDSISFIIKSDGAGFDKIIVPAGGFRTPATEETKIMEWDVDHNGRTKEDLHMDGLGVFSFVLSNVPKLIKQHLEFVNLDNTSVGLFALHQSNSMLLKLIAKKLKVSEELVPNNTKYYGNTGPSTIPLMLCDLCHSNHPYDLSKVIMSGFGVGLSWGTISADLSNTNFYEPINKIK